MFPILELLQEVIKGSFNRDLRCYFAGMISISLIPRLDKYYHMNRTGRTYLINAVSKPVFEVNQDLNSVIPCRSHPRRSMFVCF